MGPRRLPVERWATQAEYNLSVSDKVVPMTCSAEDLPITPSARRYPVGVDGRAESTRGPAAFGDGAERQPPRPPVPGEPLLVGKIRLPPPVADHIDRPGVAARLDAAGIGLPAELWRPIAVGAALASLAGIVVFAGTWPAFNTLAAVVVNVGVIAAIVVIDWQPAWAA